MAECSVRAAAAAVGVVAALGSACGGPQGHPDVLLVTVDTLRADHLGLYGYERETTPNIDRWFGNGAIYERAYTTEANTSPAVVSMLSGLHPSQHRVRLLYQLVGDDLVLLPDLLRTTHQAAAFVANVVLTDEAMGIAARFDHFDDHVDERSAPGGGRLVPYERSARRTADAALAWLREESDPERPLFLWVHFIDPHWPYAAPDGTRTFSHEEPQLVPGMLVRSKEETVDALDWVDAYDREIAYVDEQVGRLLEGYARQRPVDETLVIFTADHAESMMEHEFWFLHGYQVYEEIIRIPLMLRGPGVRRGRHERLVSLIDVAPTVLRFAGHAVPAGLPGFDLRRPAEIPHDRTAYSEATLFKRHWRAALRGQSKWVASTAAGEREILETRFYDLAADPGEVDTSRWKDGPPLADLVEQIRDDPDPGGIPEKARKGRQLRAPKVAPRATPEQLEGLRALGYVE